jgi:TP901 family phage tail tape measure protein
MAGKQYQIAFELAGKIDSSLSSSFTKTSEKMKEVSKQTSALKKELRDLDKAQKNGKISAQDFATSHDRLTKEIDKAEAAQRRLTIATKLQDKAAAAEVVTQKALRAATVAVTAGAIAATVVVGKSLSKAMDFEAELSTIQALTGLTGSQMIKMQNLAMEMGAKTKYSALEAAQGIEELLKAGLSPATVQAGGLEAALNLATAGGLGLADAAAIMSTSLNAYKADNMSAANAADILAGTANASATGVSELQLSLAAVSAVAAGVGMTFKDTNIALGLFANNGLKGSDAGTSLKTMLTNLQPTTDKQIALFKKLGLMTANGSNQFYTQAGKLKSLNQIAGTLKTALGGLTDQQRMYDLELMFGSDAIRAANIIFKEGADGVNDFQASMENVTALDVARQKMNNAAGAVEQFNGAMETLQISAMLPFLPVVKRVAEGAAELTEKYSPAIISAMDNAADSVERYLNQLAADKEFQKMNWGDKIVYVLDDMMTAINKWMSGEGGAQVEEVFTKLAEIGVKAWITALGGLAEGSLNAIKSGNLSGGGALALGAAMLGGGTILKGGISAGKGIYSRKVDERRNRSCISGRRSCRCRQSGFRGYENRGSIAESSI